MVEYGGLAGAWCVRLGAWKSGGKGFAYRRNKCICRCNHHHQLDLLWPFRPHMTAHKRRRINDDDDHAKREARDRTVASHR